MPSKPTETLPPGALTDLDLIAFAKWNGAGYDSRHAALPALANYINASLSLIGVDNIAADVTAYSFLATDNYRHKRFLSDDPVVATVPLNATEAISIGTRIRGTQAGAGPVTLTPEGGVTLNSRDGALISNGPMSVWEIEKVGTDEWDVLGDVTA